MPIVTFRSDFSSSVEQETAREYDVLVPSVAVSRSDGDRELASVLVRKRSYSES